MCVCVCVYMHVSMCVSGGPIVLIIYNIIL